VQKKWDQRTGSDKVKKVGVKWEDAVDQSDGWKGVFTCFQTNHSVQGEFKPHFTDILWEFFVIFSG
jgi:hypothetical protein